MPSQSRTWQRQIIAAAQAAGDLDRLRWFVEMDVPPRLRPSPRAQYIPASDPPGQVPVVPVTAADSRDDLGISLLCLVLTEYNKGRGIDFAPALADLDSLAGVAWYEWGDPPAVEQVDHICPACGAVASAPLDAPPRCDCRGRLGPGAGLHGGQWWGGL
jgi:hypothetical protein